MPNRTKNANMNNIMTNSEIHFHNCLCHTAQKMKFSIKNFFSKYDQIRRKLRIWSHLLKKSLMENFFVQCEFRDFTIGRSSHWRSSVKRPVPKNFAKLTEKHLCQALGLQL